MSSALELVFVFVCMCSVTTCTNLIIPICLHQCQNGANLVFSEVTLVFCSFFYVQLAHFHRLDHGYRQRGKASAFTCWRSQHLLLKVRLCISVCVDICVTCSSASFWSVCMNLCMCCTWWVCMHVLNHHVTVDLCILQRCWTHMGGDPQRQLHLRVRRPRCPYGACWQLQGKLVYTCVHHSPRALARFICIIWLAESFVWFVCIMGLACIYSQQVRCEKHAMASQARMCTKCPHQVHTPVFLHYTRCDHGGNLSGYKRDHVFMERGSELDYVRILGSRGGGWEHHHGAYRN